MADASSSNAQGKTDNAQPMDGAAPAGGGRNGPAAPPRSAGGIVGLVAAELKAHAPFTMLGTATGVAIMAAFAVMEVPRSISAVLFWSLHPLHVLLSALVTTAMFTLHSRRTLLGPSSSGISVPWALRRW